MRFSKIYISCVLSCFIFNTSILAQTATTLKQDWENPPHSAKLKAYWWWLNGNVTEKAIDRDLDEMAAKGFGGAIICDAGGAEQDGNAQVPHGPDFLSRPWKELFKHTLKKADQLGLEMSLNIQSGWNLGGPSVTADDAPKKLVWTTQEIEGGKSFHEKLQQAPTRGGYYRDLCVLAYPIKSNHTKAPALKNFQEKSMQKALHFSAPKTALLLEELPSTNDEEETKSDQVIDITNQLQKDGTLNWNAPEGSWKIIRFGYTLNDHCKVSTSSQGWSGYAIDPFDAGAFTRYWDAVVKPLLDEAKPYLGKALKYLHTDSWEVEVANWTPTLREEFLKRRGYDPLPWLPVIAGNIITSRDASNRFLSDLRRTMGDLAIDNHYRIFRQRAHESGLLIHPESGGPHAVPIDAQQCLGYNDAPMSEFWAWSWKHRVGDENRYFVKQPAMAAHTYGRKLVMAEGFTTIGPHWQEKIWDNLKPSFDHACTEGLNLLVWHAFVCSPESEGIPGQQYFAGTHLNPNVTWWEKSKPFFQYINRCQALLQRGLPVADVAYYYGNHVPNFAQLRQSDPAKIGANYDYDVVTEEVILTRMSVKDKLLTLPDGISYRILAMPDQKYISLPVLRKVKTFIEAGATIVFTGQFPSHAATLHQAEQNDKEIADIIAHYTNSRSNVIKEQSVEKVLGQQGILPDFTSTGGKENVKLQWIHRRDGEADIYFLSNPSKQDQSFTCTFRITEKSPEIWNPVTGESFPITNYTQQANFTTLPLDFPPCGSLFIIFQNSHDQQPSTNKNHITSLSSVLDLNGSWNVKFDPEWGGPAQVKFDQLISWTLRPEEGIQHYSGTATYQKTFDLPENLTGKTLTLDLGKVCEIAEIRLNGKPLGIVWTPPFQTQIPPMLLKEKNNLLEIEVVNFWANRLIGDQALPEKQRHTRTNIRSFKKSTPLMESGLLGPVHILQ